MSTGQGHVYEQSSNPTTLFIGFAAIALLVGFLGYLPWVLASYGLFPEELVGIFMLIGGASPTIGALLIAYRYFGSEDLSKVFSSFRYGLRAKWAVIALLVPMIEFYCAAALMVLIIGQGSIILFDPLLFGGLLVFYLVQNVWEEIGWRGFAHPVLQERYNAIVASIVVGVVWAAWHIPHFLVNDSQMAEVNGNFLIFMVAVLLNSLEYAWIFNSADGNLLTITAFHASGNAIGTMIMLQTGFIVQGFFLLVMHLIVVSLLVAYYRSDSLSRSDRIKFKDILAR